MSNKILQILNKYLNSKEMVFGSRNCKKHTTGGIA
jgi:hypothetical protein